MVGTPSSPGRLRSRSCVALPWLARSLKQLQLGDDTAAALGVPGERSKVLIVVVGVALTALVTAVAGPIAFIALAAPPIAARITGRSGALDLASAALVGAVLLSGADLVAQHRAPQRHTSRRRRDSVPRRTVSHLASLP